MTKYLSLFRLVAIALIVVVFGGLFGWYYFLKGQNSQTNADSAAAGYDTAAPTFEGSAGSTYANTVSTLGLPASFGTAPSSTARLWEVSAVPVAGFGWLGSQSSSTLDFVERSSGYVFEAQTQNDTVTRLTDTLRPKIYQAYITLDGSVIERSVDDDGALVTFTGTVASSSPSDVTTATSTGEDLAGNDLPSGIDAIAADPASDTLFYLLPGPSGVSLVSTDFSGTKEKQLFSSAIVGWQLFAPGDGSLVLLQDPLDGSLSYAYQVQKSGTLSLIAKAPGLTVLPHSYSTALLLGSSANGKLALYAQPSASVAPVQLSIQTVADKCAWAPGAALIAYCGVPRSISSSDFLDDWYKGLVHTSDEFYEVDASSASVSPLYDPSEDTSVQLDVEDMSVDPTGQYLAFINANDQSLWVLRIAQ